MWPWATWAWLVLVAVGVAVYVMLQRLETDVLTAIATIGCASVITLANLTLALMAFLRARERQANGQASGAMMTPPQVVVIPPMQVQTPPLLPQGAPSGPGGDRQAPALRGGGRG
jgi:cytochrome c biogenesis factor